MTPGAPHAAASSVGLRDVARLAGVSEATASRALAGSRSVRSELRERVLRSAATLDYRPNPHARALARARDASVGVVVHDVGDPYFAEIVRGALSAAQANERMLLICDTGRDPERELAYLRHFRAQRVEAVLIAGSGRNDRAATAALSTEVLGLEAAGARAILIGRHEVAGDCVMPDNVGGARAVARHLAGLGHRQIGVIAGPMELTTTADRLFGFRAGLAELGIRLDSSWIRCGEFTRDGGARAALALLERHRELTALFALNDLMAIGALSALRRLGSQVPGQVSVAGFDDVASAGDVTPALTTVRVPTAEIGRRAFDLAFAPRGEGFRRERIATELVIRQSTAPPARRRMPEGPGAPGRAVDREARPRAGARRKECR